MNTQQVYINASEVKYSHKSGELTQINLTKDQLFNQNTNSNDEHSVQKSSVNENFLYQTIDNQNLGQDAVLNTNERIFKILFEVIDDLIKSQNLSVQELAETSLFLGSSSMDVGVIKSDPLASIWLTPIDKITETLTEHFGLNSLKYTFTTACTSSANAIIYATRLLKSHRIKRAIVIGCEFFNQLTLRGFSSLGLLTSESLLAFSPNRSGMILGEGVGALLLSNKSFSQNNLEILSGYSACDSFSLTTSNEDGSHIAGVIKKALDMADLKAEKVDLIKVHGTASPGSDDAELSGLKQVFTSIPPIMALKPFTGHTLGACAAVETAIVHKCIKSKHMPMPDYAENLKNCSIQFANKNISMGNYRHMLHNYCGFGGNNAAIVFRNQNEPSDYKNTSDTQNVQNWKSQ